MGVEVEDDVTEVTVLEVVVNDVVVVVAHVET